MIAIQIADFFILKKDRADRSVSVQNLAIWLVGFVLYRFLMTKDIIVGDTLPDMAATVLLCCAVEFFAKKLSSKKKEEKKVS